MLKSNTVLIETEFGNMKIKLYDETPKHKENFIKLAANGFYNELLFHRIINEFMIQGGDPDSKNAASGIMLGDGGPGYQIPAEFNDSLFHKKGVIAAAREGDQINPQKESSGSQFYIVQGKKFTDEELDNIEIQQSIGPYINSHPELQDIVTQLQQQNDRDGLDKFVEDIQEKKDFKIIKIPDFKRKVYNEIGGTPHLDNNYTVFGEVIEGLEVIDKIAGVIKDSNDRPVKDVKMNIKVIVE
ncbi:MAG: peptidylprolyl isomerase [Bacteroidales bacterium]|nr:peptidylprolyl isomerase [Bacteroidales bacterium]